MRTNSSNPITVTCPIALTTGTWNVYAELVGLCMSNGDGSTRITGSGATWELGGSNTVGGTGNGSEDTFYVNELIGTAIGGQTPSVTLTYPSWQGQVYTGVLKLVVTRVS